MVTCSGLPSGHHSCCGFAVIRGFREGRSRARPARPSIASLNGYAQCSCMILHEIVPIHDALLLAAQLRQLPHVGYMDLALRVKPHCARYQNVGVLSGAEVHVCESLPKQAFGVWLAAMWSCPIFPTLEPARELDTGRIGFVATTCLMATTKGKHR